MVVQSEIGDARRAKVYGRGLSEGRTFEMSEFIVDTRDAGLLEWAQNFLLSLLPLSALPAPLAF